MNIGKLDTRVRIYEKAAGSSDGMGGVHPTLGLLKTIWAEVKEVSTDRYLGDGRVKHNREIKVRIRKDTSILGKYLIYYDSTYFIINDVYSDDKNTHIKCYE